MNNMLSVIIPKSDQLNADDLLGGPRTITITKVEIRPGTEQPVSIHFDGDTGKPYKCCKSMARVMVTCWGPDANQYVGRSMTIYCDPKVMWGGMAVGGIRISHMTDIKGDQTMALTATRGNKKPFTVHPLTMGAPATKQAATIPEWITNTLAPALSKCTDLDGIEKIKQSKGYVAASDRGTDDDRADMAQLVAEATKRIEETFPGDKP